ncbi:MAG: tRNA glutamyl-Q(34) synthetase GluQRS [Pseudomonadota bacterium]
MIGESPSSTPAEQTSAATPRGGRFAPTPSGPLHWGSLFTALISYLSIRAVHGHWFLRLDDLDTPRIKPGATDQILEALESHGLCWDGPVQRQSDNIDAYEGALAALKQSSALFYCTCSRRETAGRPYPGTCRQERSPRPGSAVRIAVDAHQVHMSDRFAGRITCALSDEGDFILRRRDGVIAYQLASAVDDGDPRITDVVRGRDLRTSSAKQLFLIDRLEVLGLTAPTYSHVPLFLSDRGAKLSKSLDDAPIEPAQAPQNVFALLRLLGLAIDEGYRAPVSDQLAYAIAHWPREPAPPVPFLAEETVAGHWLASRLRVP